MLESIDRQHKVGQDVHVRAGGIEKLDISKPNRLRRRLFEDFIPDVHADCPARALLGEFDGLIAIAAAKVHQRLSPKPVEDIIAE